MGFWDALGQGIEQYGMNRLKNGRHGGMRQGIMNAMQQPVDHNPYSLDRTPATQPDPNTPGAGVQSGPPQPQSMNQMIDPEASMMGAPDLSMDAGSAAASGGDKLADIGVDMFGGGKIVTQPTLAEVGDKGPEAIVPLTDQPGAKVTPGMLGGAPRTRWGHPAGPVASKRTSPVRGLLPVKPNAPFR